MLLFSLHILAHLMSVRSNFPLRSCQSAEACLGGVANQKKVYLKKRFYICLLETEDELRGLTWTSTSKTRTIFDLWWVAFLLTCHDVICLPACHQWRRSQGCSTQVVQTTPQVHSCSSTLPPTASIRYYLPATRKKVESSSHLLWQTVKYLPCDLGLY